MKASEVYLKAAEFVASDPEALGACIEICVVQGKCFDGDEPAVVQFTNIIQPPDKDAGHWWEFNEEGINERVLGLLFAHHIAADEERK